MVRTSILMTLAMVLLQTSFAQEQTDVFISGEGGYHTYRIPALIVTGKGTLLAFCEGRKTSASDAGDIDLLVKRSTDEGATWSDSEIAHEEGGDAENTIGNPCPIVDTSPSVAHLLFTRNNERIFYTSSDDDGNAWAAPIEITNVLEDFDFPWTRVGTGPGHGLQLSSGRLIVPVWLNERIGYNYRSSVIYSDDGGATWHAGGLVGPEVADTNECMAVEMSDGTIYLNMRAKDSNSRTVAWSEDGGVTWSAPLSDVGLPDSVCQASVLRVDERVLFTNPSGPGRANLLVRESDDGAKTWHIPRTIHDGPSAYSDLAISRDGETVFCLYECGATGPYECLRLHRISLAE